MAYSETTAGGAKPASVRSDPSPTSAGTSPCPLYAGILGDCWARLAEPIRLVHLADGRRCGRFRVTHGRSRLARSLARWSRLPKETEATDVVLNIRTERSRQLWNRSFGGRTFASVQYATGDGLLRERIRQWEFRFELRVEDSALRYEQRAARLCLGPIRLPLPAAWSPSIRAREFLDGSERVRVEVSVHLPLIGPLVAYAGSLNVALSQS